MHYLYTRTLTGMLCLLLTVAGIAQTNPAAQSLPYAFTSQLQATATPPAGMALHKFSSIPTTRTTGIAADDLPNITASTSGGWRGEGNDGISMLASGTQQAGAMVVAINTTGKTNIKVDWTVRLILNQARDASVALQYRVGTSGAFTDVGTTTTYNSTGNNAGHSATYSETLPAGAQNQAVVQVRWIYWDLGASGARDRVAIDEIGINSIAVCTPPTNQPTALNLTPGFTDMTGSFTAAVAGTTPAESYLVVVSPTASLGALPEQGDVYVVDDIIGNGRVVSTSNSTSFSVTNLNPGTTYYYFVFSYVNTLCYNLTNPLTGQQATNTPPPCTPPATGATALQGNNITGTSIDLAYTRGSGDNVLILSRAGSAVSETPVNGVTYTAGSMSGLSRVIYNGPAAGFAYTSLSPNTTYYFAVFEYAAATNCYVTAPLTGSYTTLCTSAPDVTALSAAAGNASAAVNWTNPGNAGCFTEIIVVTSNAPVTGNGATYASGTANTVYSGPNQIVFRGVGNNVNVTGLSNGTQYYFKVFTRNGSNYSAGIQTTVTPFDPATGYVYLYGNLHAHSSYSDGNKDDLTKTPKDDYEFARDANCMDFMGMSEHNHSDAGMSKPNYLLGFNQANQLNGVVGGSSGNALVTLWGMEWGTISGGGHILLYGFEDKLLGWQSGNYDILSPKSDFTTLFGLVNNQADAFATLAHPNNSDYGNLLTTYKPDADAAIVGTAIESGPAFSTSTSYNDYPSSLSYMSYYRNLLAKGYRIGAQMDHDNHNLTFGRTSGNRMVVMASAKTRPALVSAIRAMRFYASQDCNVRIDYKLNNNVMGSNVVNGGAPVINLTVTDPDGENTSNIELWGGNVGDGPTASAITSFANSNTATFAAAHPQNLQPNNTTWYYYFIVTQADGNKVVTSPIWYTRNDVILPVSLFNFHGSYDKNSKYNMLYWNTAQESNSAGFTIQRSIDGGRTYTDLGTVQAAGYSNANREYQFADKQPVAGTAFYRLKMFNKDQTFSFSPVITITPGAAETIHYTVYPNPANGFTWIQTTSNETVHLDVQLLDANGRILRNQPLQVRSRQRFDLTGLAKGLYFIRISDTKNNVTRLEKVTVL